MNFSARDKALRFQALHRAPRIFLMPNPWDAGSARLLAGLGFPALATSSFAHAATLGRRDGAITRAEALAHAGAIVAATDLPVSADLEKGFGETEAELTETIHAAAAVGLAGGSIEDATGESARPLYAPAEAAERVAAAVAAARGLSIPFTVTARAENFMRGNPDLDDTIRRLQAYEAAGADVLFAPGLPTLDAVRAVCSAVSKPVSFMAGIPGQSFTVAALEQAGVRRISLGASFYKAAMGGMLAAAREVLGPGAFAFANAAPTAAQLFQLMER